MSTSRKSPSCLVVYVPVEFHKDFFILVGVYRVERARIKSILVLENADRTIDIGLCHAGNVFDRLRV